MTRIKPTKKTVINGLSVSFYEPTEISPYYISPDEKIRLYLGDSFAILRHLNPEQFDLIFADPPYFLSNNGITCHSGRIACVNKGTWDKPFSFEDIHDFNLRWLRQCQRLLKPGGTIFISGTTHNIYSVGFALQNLGFKILNDIIWYKINPPPNISCRYFVHSTETILWAKRDSKGKHKFDYEKMKSIGDPQKGKQMHSLWRILPPTKHEKRYGKHPTQKPEELLTRIISAASNPNDLILDPFNGSGTAGVVAARLGRQYIGIDISKEYLDLSAKRIHDEYNFSQTKI